MAPKPSSTYGEPTKGKVDFEKQERMLHARAAKFRALTAAPGNKSVLSRCALALPI